MNAIVRTPSLNDAFKRFQRLPELPMIEVGGHRRMQSFMAAQPVAPEAEQSRDADEERLTEVLAN
jgi:hypothetical protein